MEDKEFEEGWYTDPFGRHEARWLSAGKPTKLVRDGDVEGYDDPPDETPTVIPVRIEDGREAANGGDLRRADDVEREPAYDPKKAARAVLDVFDQSGGRA